MSGQCERVCPIYYGYLQRRSTQSPIPEILTTIRDQFQEIREKFDQISFEDAIDGLGRETPIQESNGYFSIGMPILGGAIGLCELGALIASDPDSVGTYKERDAVIEVATGFLEEARRTAELSYLFKDCPMVQQTVARALRILEQAITPFGDSSKQHVKF